MSGNAPLLARVGKGARNAFPIFQSLSETNLNATAIVTQARAAGFSFKTQDAFDIIAALRDNQSTAQYLRSIDMNQLPNPDMFTNAPNNQLRNYSYRVVARGRNPDTGETINQNVVVSTNQVLTQQQVLDMATAQVTNPAAPYNMTIDSLQVTTVFKKQGA